MPLEKLNHIKRPRHVIEGILSSIQDGTLKAGERLPSEAKLAELTGVGRTSVREALAALRLMGVIETRVGSGTYIAASADLRLISSEITSEIARAISASEEALQLQEARSVFECGLVRLAIARWSPEKTRAFERLFADMEKTLVTEGYADYIRLHRTFHLMLAQATENMVVERTEISFLECMDHEGWRDMEEQFLLPNRGDLLRTSLDEHRHIIEAVAAQDVVRAADAMHNHFIRHEEADLNA